MAHSLPQVFPLRSMEGLSRPAQLPPTLPITPTLPNTPTASRDRSALCVPCAEAPLGLC